MSRDFQQTHENLLLCAQKHFLEYGFERASIREICKDAHVTNGAFYNHFEDKEALFGALVEPVVQEVKAIYEASVNEHMELAKTDDLKSLWKLSEKTLSAISNTSMSILMCSGYFLCGRRARGIPPFWMMLSVWKPGSR